MRFPNVGEVFQNKYELLDELGRGGFAAVYRARDVDIDRQVALKVLVPNLQGAYDESLVARFHREARVVAQLADPHSITMFDFGRTDDGLLFMVFEYVAGRDLSETLKELGALHPSTVIHILTQVLEALREAHAAGVLHRDIKPANILVYSYMDDDWQVKLLDFGIAKAGIGRNADPVATITQAGGVVGTPRYMSQEQLCGEDLGPSTDIYSLGLVAFELLMGRPAIDGKDTRTNIALQLSPRRLEFPADSRIPPPLRAIIEKMIERDSEDRFQTADEAIGALSALQAQSWSGPVPLHLPPPQLQTGPQARIRTGPQTALRPHLPPESTKPGSGSGGALSPGVLALIGLAIGAAVALAVVALRKPIEQQPPEQPVVRRTPAVRPALEVRPLADPAATEPDAAVADEVPVNGCGSESESGMTYPELEVGGMGGSRTWLQLIPTGYDATTPVPLVVVLHDKTRKPLNAIQDTEFGALADEHGFVVVAPKGDWMPPWKPEDAAFVEELIEHTQTRLCIDPGRIYGVGHYYGGMAVELFACDLPFAAIATTSWRGSNQLACAPEPPIPFMHLVGDGDMYQPIDGGAPCDAWFTRANPVPPLVVKDSLWDEANECSGARKVVMKKPSGTCWTREKCEAPFVSCLWKGGRDWPAAAKRDIETEPCRRPTTKFPVAKTVWDFLSQHRRGDPP